MCSSYPALCIYKVLLFKSHTLKVTGPCRVSRMLVATLFPFRFAKAAVSKQRVSAEEQLMINDQFFRHSFVYPDFSTETEELQEFIANDLLEGTHKKALERSGVCTYMCVCMSSLKCVCRCMYVRICMYVWGV